MLKPKKIMEYGVCRFFRLNSSSTTNYEVKWFDTAKERDQQWQEWRKSPYTVISVDRLTRVKGSKKSTVEH